METLDPSVGFVMDDDLLNFSLDDEDDKNKDPSSSLELQHPDGHTPSFPEFAEEELEWLSNKDAFPPVEMGLDILSQNLDPTHAPSQSNHKSPNSVLENSASSSSNGSAIMSCCVNLQIPGKARSKRRRRRRRGFPDLPGPQYWWWAQVNIKNEKQESPLPLSQAPPVGSVIGRRCQHCLAEKTPQWRAGPMGPKTLCNACGVRYKSGRLVPEYRPASSPTFSSEVHSNSHRKIMEMRKQSQVGDMMVNEACEYRVG